MSQKSLVRLDSNKQHHKSFLEVLLWVRSGVFSALDVPKKFVFRRNSKLLAKILFQLCNSYRVKACAINMYYVIKYWLSKLIITQIKFNICGERSLLSKYPAFIGCYTRHYKHKMHASRLLLGNLDIIFFHSTTWAFVCVLLRHIIRNSMGWEHCDGGKNFFKIMRDFLQFAICGLW